MATSPIKLTYTPPWYRIGDADQSLIALAYGLLAMCTVWVFESLVHNLLFSSDLHISVAEAAALFTFKSAAWPDIFRWSLRGRGLRRNKRAHVAVFLRLIITAVDVLIVVCAVPKSFRVYERDTGTPMINFQRRGNRLLPKPNSAIFEFNACIWDKTVFDSFTPNAAILICSTQNSFEKSTSTSSNSNDIAFMVTHNRSFERLVFKSMSDSAVFFITHNLFIPGDEGRVSTTFSLPLPTNVAEQAVQALSSDPEFRRKCKRIPRERAPINGEGEYFTCDRRIVPDTNELRQRVIIATLKSIYTTRIDARGRKFRKVKPGGMEHPPTPMGEYIGTVNRPLVVS